jgi:hypothetical protein
LVKQVQGVVYVILFPRFGFLMKGKGVVEKQVQVGRVAAIVVDQVDERVQSMRYQGKS